MSKACQSSSPVPASCFLTANASPFSLPLQKWFLYLGSLILLFNFYLSLRQRFNFWVLFMCITITFILEMYFVACIPLLSSVHKTSELLRPSKSRQSFPSEEVGVAWFSRAWESHVKSVPCDLWSNLSYAAISTGGRIVHLGPGQELLPRHLHRCLAFCSHAYCPHWLCTPTGHTILLRSGKPGGILVTVQSAAPWSAL